MARRVAAQAHGDLLVLERTPNEKGVLRQQIAVDDVRRTISFFGATAGEGGWRIAIVDAVDELNRAGANALLKVLEEPPERALLLLVMPFGVAGAADAALALQRVGDAASWRNPMLPAHWRPRSDRPRTIRRSKRPPRLPTAAWRALWRFWTRTHWRCASARSKSSSDCRRSMPTLCMRSAMRLWAPTHGRLVHLSIPSTLGCRETSINMAP